MTMGDFFSNCSDHYPIEKYFLNCTNTTRQCDLIRDVANVSFLLLIFDNYISSLLFSIAFVINVYFLSISLPLFLKMNRETKKRYVFVVSRCTSSVVASCTLLILHCILQLYFPPKHSNFYLYAFVIIADDIAFHSLQGSYILMAIILYIGVIHPVYFSKRLTLRKIYWLAIINWIGAAVISVPCGLLQAATSTSDSNNCDTDFCSPIVTFVNFIIVSITLLSTILILSFVLICLSLHIYRQKNSGGFSSSKTLLNARIRLAWTLFAILFISLAEGIPSSFLLEMHNAWSTCANFYHADKVSAITIFTSLDSLVWAVVLLIDPLANIIFDELIFSEVLKQIDRAKVIYAKFLNFCFSASRK